MPSSDRHRSEQLDRLFDEFVYGDMGEDERSALQESASRLQQRLTDAADMIKGVLADREGREALAKALREGIRDV